MTYKVIFFSISLLKLIIINSSWWPWSCRLCLVYSLRVSPARLATNWQAGGLNGDPVKCEPVSWTTLATIALSIVIHGLYDTSWKEMSFCRDSRLHLSCVCVNIWEHVTFSNADFTYFMNNTNKFERQPFEWRFSYAFIIEATFPT